MFLFDKYRSSRQNAATGDNVDIRWKTFLPANPAFCAESTAIVDKEGNFYFGSHSGNFYSLSPDGVIRWSFYTKAKIYGSPLFSKGNIVFASGDGWLYSLTCDAGKIVWMVDLKKGYFDSFKQKMVQTIIHLPYTLNLGRRMLMDTKCWSSALLVNGRIYITAYGKGFYCLDEDGNVMWSLDLGYPRYQLSGVVTDNDNNLYFASRKGYLFCYTSQGVKNWSRKMGLYNVWGNPSFDDVNKLLLVPLSKGESKGIIRAYSNKGTMVWEAKLNGAIYGSVAIDANRQFYYCADFKGFIYKIESKTGSIVASRQLSTAIRALWTTPTIDKNGCIYITTKDKGHLRGRIIKLNNHFSRIWEYPIGQALSVPLILKNGDVCAGSWDGYYYCLKTL